MARRWSRRAERRGNPPRDGSTRVVHAALAGNLLVAASKFVAAAVSGSSAMLTEAIHSTADCTNQVLLLVGVRRGRRPSDASHRFGYGMEIYFWTFVVAVLVLLAGGAYSAFQGLERLAHPAPVRSPEISLGVLLVSALFEGASFRIGYREYKVVEARHRTRGRRRSLMQFIKWSKDPSLYESLLEDGAALLGLAVAAAGIVSAAYLGVACADGAASLVIGVILLATGTAILVATRSLIAGEAVAPPVLADLWAAVRTVDPAARVTDLATLHLGPSCIFIAVTLAPPHGASDGTFLKAVEQGLRAADQRVLDVFFHYS